MTNTTSEVHEALRAWARGIYPTEAATELLIRTAMVSTEQPWVQPGDDPGWWWINFEELTRALNAGTAHSGGERRLLSIAASLGGHSPEGFRLADALPGLDRKHLALVLAAVAHAGGSHEHHDTSALENAAAAGLPLDRSMLAGTPLGSLYPWPEQQA
ncbi:hypothetical protein [Actinotalea sp. K2]|uniref:hypothetical protein n=1 Tax=Actinotalea sp. K2 TaxID=2939438 RepID=UPI0020182EAC|nr:hypothetical protein [Actinotalea sp. K2]MCL3863017.1 hypothetical protein [Actinotalea sp. K2]